MRALCTGIAIQKACIQGLSNNGSPRKDNMQADVVCVLVRFMSDDEHRTTDNLQDNGSQAVPQQGVVV
jgi:hypothetical protein